MISNYLHERRSGLSSRLYLQDVFKVNFVIVDSQSHAVDNNKGKDYEVNLLDALSEEQITERQAVTLAEMEDKRLQVSSLSPIAGML